MTNTQAKNTERQKSVEKTEAILKGAKKEFLVHGYAATSMDRVAKSAGVSKATIYSHFGDKEGLFNALIKSLAENKFQTIMGLQEPQSLEKNPKKVLQDLATRMLENAKSDRTFQDFIRIIIGESGRFPELAQAYVKNIAKPALETLTFYFKSHPELKIKDVEATVRVMMGSLVYFIILQEMMHGQEIIPLESDRLVDTLTDLIIGDR